MAGKAVVAAAAAAALARGAPMKPRALGHGEAPLVEPPAVDAAWAFRGALPENGDAPELTREPVKRTPSTSGARRFQPGIISGDAAAAGPGAEAWPAEVDALVVGGAAGGLSAAACLKRRGVRRVLVVEKNERPGDIWRSRYHRLHLHDIIEECALPYADVPDAFPVFATRQQYAAYLEAYATLHALDVRCLCLVTSLRETGAGGGSGARFSVDVKDLETGETHTVLARHVVLANGIYNDPYVPVDTTPGFADFPGPQIHTARYTNGTELGLANKKVLVVGFGNSAGEVAVDLVEHGAKPTILARSPQVIAPRWVFQRLEAAVYTHVRPMLKVPFGWVPLVAALALLDPAVHVINRFEYGAGGLEKLGFPVDRRGPVLKAVMDKEPPLMDIGTVELARRGLLRVVGRASIARMHKDGTVDFTNGESDKFDAVVWGTGYAQFAGHKHFMAPDLLAKVGTGVDALVEKRVTPGAEVPGVPGLHVLYGRIQMLREGADGLAWRVAADVGASSADNDRIDASEPWSVTLAKHAIVGAAGLAAWRSLRAAPAAGGGKARL